MRYKFSDELEWLNGTSMCFIKAKFGKCYANQHQPLALSCILQQVHGPYRLD